MLSAPLNFDPPTDLAQAIDGHFRNRQDDHWMICNGPTSEIWYTTELIVGITRWIAGNGLTWLAHRVSGQENLRELGASTFNRVDGLTIPDLNIFSGFSDEPFVDLLAEAKLVNSGDFRFLGWRQRDGILTQVERNFSAFPDAVQLGIIFVEWRSNEQYQINQDDPRPLDRDTYFALISQTLNRTMRNRGNKFEWVTNDIETCIARSPAQELNGFANETTALGIGIIRRKSYPIKFIYKAPLQRKGVSFSQQPSENTGSQNDF